MIDDYERPDFEGMSDGRAIAVAIVAAGSFIADAIYELSHNTEKLSETMSAADDLASVLKSTLISPNVSDSNFEPANVVDAISSIARAIERLGAK